MKAIIYIATLTIAISSYSAKTLAGVRAPWLNSSIEIATETDGTSRLSGINFMTSISSEESKLSAYIGGGPVYVKLPEANDEFPAIHILTGARYHFNDSLAVTGEIGFDLIEEIFDSERGDDNLNQEHGNDVDFSVALGLMFQLDRHLYLHTYYRHHVFDGIFLETTRVDFFGVRIGFNY